MIRPLRQRHRLMVGLMAIVMPAILVVAALNRPDYPRNDFTLTAAGPLPLEGTVAWERDDLFNAMPVQVALRTGDSRQLVLAVRDGVTRPDVLVYWIPDGVEVAEHPPVGSRMLGAFQYAEGQAFRLPREIAGEGRLLLYSLAWREIVELSESFTPAP